jgi:hypothetical protein
MFFQKCMKYNDKTLILEGPYEKKLKIYIKCKAKLLCIIWNYSPAIHVCYIFILLCYNFDSAVLYKD